MADPFKLIDAVSHSKKDWLRDEVEPVDPKEWNSYLANRSFSYHPDSIFYANDMNGMDIDGIMVHDYYLHALRSRRRRSKWFKPEAEKDAELLTRVLGVGMREARKFLTALQPKVLEALRKKYTQPENGVK